MTGVKEATKEVKDVLNNPFADFETDAKAEREGIKLDFGGYWFYVARLGGKNQGYKKALNKSLKPHRLAMDNDLLSPDEVVSLLVQPFVSDVLRGWGSKLHGEGNLVDRNGDAIPFTAENAMEVFTKLPDLFTRVSQRASDHENFLLSNRKAAEGN